MCRYKKYPQPQCQQCPKAVQEVQTNDLKQNTGNYDITNKDIDIINMIRSLGLHEQRKTMKDNQLHQHLSVQELCIQHELCNMDCNPKPVFNTPVTTVDTNIVWEDCQNIMELDIHVTTPTVISRPQVDVITIHDVELKWSHYSYVTIARHPVKIKQDTGAEVNVMLKCVFDRLSNGAMRNITLLNKA